MRVWVTWERQQTAHIFHDCPELRDVSDEDVEHVEFSDIQRAVCSQCWDRSFREKPSN